jgi:hypothetical protein
MVPPSLGSSPGGEKCPIVRLKLLLCIPGGIDATFVHYGRMGRYFAMAWRYLTGYREQVTGRTGKTGIRFQGTANS